MYLNGYNNANPDVISEADNGIYMFKMHYMGWHPLWVAYGLTTKPGEHLVGIPGHGRSIMSK